MKYAIANRQFGGYTNIIALEDDLSVAERIADELDVKFGRGPYYFFEVVEIGLVRNNSSEDLMDFLQTIGIHCRRE